MNNVLVGREAEIGIMERLLNSKEPELLAIYGRRRVGKTFLIRTYYKDHIVFSCIGEDKAQKRVQLANFAGQLRHHFFPDITSMVSPSSWREAFEMLRNCLESLNGKKKKVIFFDELPWLDSHKSGFLSAFGYFWNNYIAQRSDVVVVICGSAASWIINKVVNNKGGLHNRITQRIRLMPFTLKETEAYLKQRDIRLDHYQLLQLYMVMGGVPAYLKSVERGKSAQQTIEQACFSKDGILTGEFGNLYAALFDHPDKHIEVIQALARKNKGLTRTELLKAGKLLTGGGMTGVLNELLESGFIQKTLPFEKKEKDSLYRLSDEFSLFYLRFMQKNSGHGVERDTWLGINRTPAYTSWCGYAFENLCIKHVGQMKKALGISGIRSVEASWYHAGTKKGAGAQIDLLIDRADRCINVCEMKFSGKPFVIDKKYARELESKLAVFRGDTATDKTLFTTVVTTYGIFDNDYKTQRVDVEVTMEKLFA
jgi:hypothetical protein